MLTRRDFLKFTSLGVGSAVVSTGIVACSSSSGTQPDDRMVAFDQGVASGDPLNDAVIIWSRAVPDEDGPVAVQWEVALDPDFADLTHSGSSTVSADSDYTIKVDVRDLQPNTGYYYRFTSHAARR